MIEVKVNGKTYLATSLKVELCPNKVMFNFNSPILGELRVVCDAESFVNGAIVDAEVVKENGSEAGK